MSIEIVIKDPANVPAAQMSLLIQMLQRFSASAPISTVIAAPDLPDVGALNGDDARDAFENGAQPANLAFGGAAATTPEQAFSGNGQPAALPSAALAATGTSTTPNTATGSGPNVAPSTMPNGAPPAPTNGAATAGGTTLDSAGLPWDIRIHAKSSTGPGGVTVANGTWRKKAKVDPALVATVEAELRALMALPAPGAAMVPPPPPPPPAAHTVPAGYGAQVPPPPPAPAPASVPAPVSAATFPEFMQFIGMSIGGGKLDMDEVNNACRQFGIPDVTLLNQRLEFLPSVDQVVRGIVASKG